MRESFDAAISFVLSHEGGYSFDENDPGGETRWGISKRSHPNEDIKNLTVDRAKEIYLLVWCTKVNNGENKLRVVK
jgi:lysozyme family protein